ncbi:hypothetical protein Saut_0180 [Sulfurimonas autotrophica DSM 16294]|uniref:Uncharacterized protein n=1 Tax=Sulfurimonas autotrophica (strain ATCC BAA-671 / DSM 16294 / JCM 11897 / OK10) TaxID=563040 RepID=E0UTC6_SULAO|nr:hypothetical protein Saut_0180 [Sulfurimonas autotrophica DSM 16294]
MLEMIVAVIFAVVAYYVAEKDNKESDLYQILHQQK